MVRELISIIAGVLVLIALIPKDKPIFFRIFNMAGSIMFVVYGILLVTANINTGYALAILNAICFCISANYLIRYFKDKKKKNESNKENKV